MRSPLPRHRAAPRPLDEELARLAEALRAARNGGFILLTYDDPAQRAAWLEALRARLGDAAFFAPPLPEDGVGLLPEILSVATSSAAAAADLSVLVVQDVEGLEPAARERLAVNLNLMRTRLAQVGYPILICGGPDTLALIAQTAPDLFDRVGVWADVRGHVPPAVAPVMRGAEATYRATLVRRLRRVEFRGILSIDKPVSLPLEAFYVPLSADQVTLVEEVREDNRKDDPEDEGGASVFDTFERELQKTLGASSVLRHELDDKRKVIAHRRLTRQVRRETATLPVAEVLGAHPVVVVLGDPGAGKSTLLRYVAVAAAEGAPQTAGLPEASRPWLPVLISCAALADSLAAPARPDVVAAVVSCVEQQYAGDGIGDMVRDALAEGRAFLLLDGLDEVLDSEQRSLVARAIDELLRTVLPRGNRAIISSRIAGFADGMLPSVRVTATLRSFDDDQVRAFLRGWCVAFEHFVRGDVPEAERDGARQAEELVSALAQNDGARRLAQNPLLVTIIALIQRQGVRLPDRRAELYDVAARTLIESWNRARSLSGLVLRTLPDSRFVMAALGAVALHMQQHVAAGTATAADLLPRLVAIHQDRGIPEPERAAAAFLSDVRDYTGLLVERGPDRYAFLHLTFQEYFAARAIVSISDNRQRWALIEPHLYDPRWREAIRLVAGELGRIGRTGEVTDLVRRMVDTPKPSPIVLWLFRHPRLWFLLSKEQVDQITEHLLGQRLLLAAEILADDPGIAPETAGAVVDALAQLTLSSIEPVSDNAAACLKNLPPPLQAHAARQLNTVLTNQAEMNKWVRAANVLSRFQASVDSDSVAALLNALRADDVRVRQAAVYALGKLPAPSEPVVAALLNALRADDVRVRQAAAYALGNLPAPSEPVVAALLNALRDNDGRVREAAAYALGKLPAPSEPVVAALLNALRDNDVRVRQAAAYALGNLPAPSEPVVAALLNALRADDVRVRQAAVQALGNLPAPSEPVVAALLNALRDNDRSVREAAVQALGNLPAPSEPVVAALLNALRDNDGRVREAAAYALGNLPAPSEPVVAALLNALRADDRSMREAAAYALGNLPAPSEPVVAALLNALRADDRSMREAAAYVLGNLPAPSEPVVAALLNALRDNDRSVRQAAVQALGNLPAPSEPVVAALLNALRDNDRSVRQAAVQALGNLPAPSEPVVAALLNALRADDGRVREAAVYALGKLPAPSEPVVAALLNALRDNDRSVRQAAVQALGKLPAPSEPVVAALLNALRADDVRVRQAAAYALGNLPAPSEPVVAALLNALRDQSKDVRIAVAQALMKLGHFHHSAALILLFALIPTSIIVGSSRDRDLYNLLSQNMRMTTKPSSRW